MKKSIITIVVAILLVSLTSTMNTAAAERIIELQTFLHVMVSPNPTGVGQTVIITVQMDKTSPTAMGVTGGDHFKGYIVEIKKPDGSKEQRGPFEAWSTSGFFLFYTPDMEGTYVIQARFPGQWINTTTFATGGYLTNTKYYFKPSESKPVELIVQAEKVEPWPDIPFPKDYWTRPIYAENKGWWRGADNWLMQCYNTPIRDFCVTTAFAPYTKAPNTPHILWTRQMIFGGIAGGPFGDKKYYTGLSYEQFYTPLILEGRIIYVEHAPTVATPVFGTRCIDLYTGEDIWFLDGVNIAFAQIYNIENPNEHGLIAHLWEVSGPVTNTTAKIYDAFTGRYLFTIKNIVWGGIQRFSAGPTIFGERGEILSYYLDNVRQRLVLWNSSLAIHKAFPWVGGEVGMIYNPSMGGVVDGRLGIQWNVSTPKLPGNPTISVIGEGYILAQDRVAVSTSGVYKSQFIYIDVCFDAKTGAFLWTKNRTEIYSAYFRRPMVISEGRYVMMDESELRLYCYDIKTGDRLWASDPMPSGWDIFTYQIHIAYGKVYTTSYSGHVYAYDLNTGKLVWDFYMGNAGVETVYGSWPTYNGFTIADGKIYVANDEHSPDSVAWRGGRLWCINAYTGELIWSLSGWLRNPAIADGYLTALNCLDGKIYTIGRGPSATTVYVQQDVIPLGSTVLIKGTVTDKSPGQPGTPAVAAESMAAWMEYLHMQKPCPSEVKGVSVDIYAIYPDGTYNHIGTAETEPLAGGVYGIAWKPPMEGTYTIIAVFNGDESYGSSSAGTVIHVTPAPPEVATQEQVESTTEATKSAIAALQPLLAAMIAMTIICICLVIYVLHINKRILRQTSR
ncbi:MAG: PQQ-binding-like beta-propeller repeat protein [Candidatus Bathyarchaeia archaeon]